MRDWIRALRRRFETRRQRQMRYHQWQARETGEQLAAVFAANQAAHARLRRTLDKLLV